MSAVCRRPQTDLSEEAALEVLIPTIEEVAALFVTGAGLERLYGIEVEVSAKDGGEGRNFAACRTDGRLLVFSPDLLALPPETVYGIVLHEFGHAADFLYPAQWVPIAGGKVRLADVSSRGVPAGESPVPTSWLRDWEARDSDEVERAADRIAESVSGIRIGYGGPCLLQTVARGAMRPRPPGLR